MSDMEVKVQSSMKNKLITSNIIYVIALMRVGEYSCASGYLESALELVRELISLDVSDSCGLVLNEESITKTKCLREDQVRLLKQKFDFTNRGLLSETLKLKGIVELDETLELGE